MNCRIAIRQLPAYLDHELAEAEANELEAHLEVCVFCSTELSALRATSKMLDSWRDVHPQRPHAAAVIKQIRAEERGVVGNGRIGVAFWASRFSFSVLRAAAVVVFLIGSALFCGRAPINGPTREAAADMVDDREALRDLIILDEDVTRNYIRPSESWLLRAMENRGRPIQTGSWGTPLPRGTNNGSLPGDVTLPVDHVYYFSGDGKPVESIIPVGGP